MSTGERSPLRLRGRVLAAGAGSTLALVAAVAAVALVGAGLVAFDAWPRPEAGRDREALPLAAGTTTVDTAPPAPGTSPAAGPGDTAPAVPLTRPGRPGADTTDPVLPGTVPAASDPAATPTTTTAPDDGTPAPAPPSGAPADPGAGGLGAAGDRAGEAVADLTREAGRRIDELLPGPPGAAAGTLTDGAADAVVQAAEVVAQALDRLPG